MATAQELKDLHDVVPAAMAAAHAYGVPASVTLAQWILESSTPEKGWGQSQLTLQAHNCFGIKAEHLEDPSTYIEMRTGEYVRGKHVFIMADFERYATVSDSFVDHARLLSQASRYAGAMHVASDPAAFAVQLQRAGYSTAPDYASELQNLMRLYNLTQYDVPPPAAPALRAA